MFLDKKKTKYALLIKKKKTKLHQSYCKRRALNIEYFLTLHSTFVLLQRSGLYKAGKLNGH